VRWLALVVTEPWPRSLPRVRRRPVPERPTQRPRRDHLTYGAHEMAQVSDEPTVSPRVGDGRPQLQQALAWGERFSECHAFGADSELACVLLVRATACFQHCDCAFEFGVSAQELQHYHVVGQV
jgi:hypothetical protein